MSWSIAGRGHRTGYSPRGTWRTSSKNSTRSTSGPARRGDRGAGPGGQQDRDRGTAWGVDLRWRAGPARAARLLPLPCPSERRGASTDGQRADPVQVRHAQPAVVLLEGEDPAATRFLQRHLEELGSVELAATPDEACHVWSCRNRSAPHGVIRRCGAGVLRRSPERSRCPWWPDPLPGLLETEEDGRGGRLSLQADHCPDGAECLTPGGPTCQGPANRGRRSECDPAGRAHAPFRRQPLPGVSGLRARPRRWPAWPHSPRMPSCWTWSCPRGMASRCSLPFTKTPDWQRSPSWSSAGIRWRKRGQPGPIGITGQEGFTPTKILRYLQALLSAVPPAPVERYTTVPPLPVDHPV